MIDNNLSAAQRDEFGGVIVGAPQGGGRDEFGGMPVKPSATPVTKYSTGRAVGGPDEMQDADTNRGYSATGQNLQEGIVAVNPEVHPMGTVFRDSATGEVFIAGDKHGNRNRAVVDFYREPQNYASDNTSERALEVVGRLEKVAATKDGFAKQLDEARSKYGRDEFGGMPIGGDNGKGRFVSAMHTFAQTAETGAGAAVKGLGRFWGGVVDAVYGGDQQDRAQRIETINQQLAKVDAKREELRKQKKSDPQLETGASELINLRSSLLTGQDLGAQPQAMIDAGSAVKADAAARFAPNPAYDGEFLASTVPQVAGSAVSSVAPFLVPGVGQAAGMGAMFGQTYDSELDKNIAMGRDDAESQRRALLSSILQAGMEPLGGGLVAGGAKRLVKGAAGKALVRNVVEPIVGEGITGAGQEFISEATAGQPIDWAEVAKQGGLEALGGGLMVGGAAGVGKVVRTVLPSGQQQQQQQAAAQPQGLAGVQLGEEGPLPGEAEAFGSHGTYGPDGTNGVQEQAPQAQPEPAQQQQAQRNAMRFELYQKLNYPLPVLDAMTDAEMAATLQAGQPYQRPVAEQPDLSHGTDGANEPNGNKAAIDPEAAAAQAQYEAEMQAELEATHAEHGTELMAAVVKAGGLPSPKSKHFGFYVGELKALIEGRRGARESTRDKGLHKNLFNETAPEPDDLVTALREQGFEFETPGDLFSAIDQTLRDGKPIYAFKQNADIDVPFAQQPAPVTEATQRAESVAKRAYKEAGIRQTPTVQAVENASQIEPGPAAVEVKTATERGNVVEAFYDPGSRKVVLVLDGIRQVAEARGISVNERIGQLALHEEVHHLGALGTLFTGKTRMGYNQIVEGVLGRMKAAELEALAKLYKYDLNNAGDRAKLAEEHLARFAEQPGKLPDWVNRALAKVRELLRVLYPKLKLGNSELRELLAAARRRLPKAQSAVGGSNQTLSQQPEMKERTFIQSARESAGVDEQVKEKIQGFYNVFTDKAAVEQAKDYINRNGLEASLQALMDDAAPNKLAYTVAHELVPRLQALGRYDEAARMINHVAETATSHGQAIQALHLISRLDASGVQVFAQRQIQRAIKENPKLKALQEEIEALKEQLSKLRQRSGTSAILEVQDLLKSLKLDTGKLSELNQKLREIMVQSGEQPGIAHPRLVGLLMGQAGMDRASATKLADKALKQFATQAKKARERLLKEAMRVPVAQSKIPQGLWGKWQALNDAGKLDDASLFEQIAKARKLPVFTAGMAQQVKAAQAEYAAAPEGPVKLAKGARMLERIYDNIPTGVGDKLRTWQVLALLLNPKTAIRNVVGNVVQMGLNVTADSISKVTLDPMVRIFTGRSTGAGPKMGSRLSGLAEPIRDFQAGYEYGKGQGLSTKGAFSEGIKTMLGMAKLTSAGKFDLNQVSQHQRHIFSSPFMRMLEDTLSFTLGTFDRAFHQSAYAASIQRQMDAASANGQELLAPTREMAEIAMFEATRAIYQNDSALAGVLRKAGEALNFNKKFGLGSAVFTFAKVPANIVIEASRWTPVGFVQTLYKSIRPSVQGMGQQELVDGFTRAIAGTAGLAFAGYWLAKLGILTAAPEEDKDLEAMRKASGFGSYSINLSALKRMLLSGNLWTPHPIQPEDVTVSYNWLQPAAMPMAAGAQIAAEQRNGAAKGLGMAEAVLKGAGRSLEDLPVFTGMVRLANNWAYSGLLAGTFQTAVTGIPSSMVPTALRQAGDLMDNSVRETRGGSFAEREINNIASRLPGLAQNYPLRYDLLGQAQERYQYGTNTLFQVLINPAFVSKVKANPLLQELDRLHAQTGKANMVPPAQGRTVTVHGQKLELTNEQIAAMQRYTGQVSAEFFNRMLAMPQFARWNDDFKAAWMAQRLSEIQGAAKMEVLGAKPWSVSPMGNVTVEQGAGLMARWARALRLTRQEPQP